MALSSLRIVNARVILPDTILDRAAVHVDDGRIAAIEEQAAIGSFPDIDGVAIVDADGAYLMPGVVDLHNDNFELEVHPRPRADLPLPFALSTMERRLANAGVTTEFHGIPFQEIPGKARSIQQAQVTAAFIADRARESRPVRHHILHRLDVWTPGSLEAALPSLRRVSVPNISLDDHTPGQGQQRDVEKLIAWLETLPKDMDLGPIDRQTILADMHARMADSESIPAFYRQITAELVQTPLVIATHDDDTVEKVDAQAVLGAGVAEFPVTVEAAKRARDRGMTILVGAPNIVRGGSQSGNLSATDLVAANLADAICADYHAPCLIPAALKLVELGLRDLPAAIAMITRNPARAVGLDDRGEIAIGQLADLVLVRIDGLNIPQVEATFVGGRTTMTFARPAEIPTAA